MLKKRFIFPIAIGLLCCLGAGFLLLRPSVSPYQDIFVNGKVLQKGHGPDCEARYEALRKVFNTYDRPFTILDIGAAEGYFSFRAAHDYNATVIMIGNPKHKKNLLQKLCSSNTELDKVVLLSKKISPEELEELGKTEHFDVVLALNIIHHFRDWKKTYDAILKLGDQVIIETPPSYAENTCGLERRAPINEQIDREPFTLLGQFRRHSDPNTIDRLVWISKPSNSVGMPGIHKSTFQCLNGTFPQGKNLDAAMGKIIFE